MKVWHVALFVFLLYRFVRSSRVRFAAMATLVLALGFVVPG